jgi:hypothetical protein
MEKEGNRYATMQGFVHASSLVASFYSSSPCIARRRALLLFDVRSERFRVRSSAVARYSLVSSDAPDRSWLVVVFRALSGVQRTEFNYMNSSQSDCPRQRV